MRYEPTQAAEVIRRLREMCDPIALMGWIDKKTRYGEKAGPEPWTYTRQFFARYDRPGEADKVIEAFALVGVKDELDASVWLAEHEAQIP